MTAVCKPAVAILRCTCGHEIQVEVPVVSEVRWIDGQQRMFAWVDQEAFDPQEPWDHHLESHGPRLD